MHARRIGLPAEVFWRLTIRELFREFAAARHVATDRYRRDVTLAWNIVRVYVKTKNDKRLPNLKALLGPAESSPKKQTMMQMKAAVMILSQQYGIPVRRAGVARG